MRKTFIAALAVLALASCNSEKSTEVSAEATATTEATANSTTITAGDIAFVDVLYVVTESEIDKNEGAALRTKIQKTQEKFAKKEQDLQIEMQQLAEKFQKRLITTLDAQNKEQDLQKRAATLQTQMQKEIPALQEEEQVLQNRIQDLIMRAVQSINADKKYKMIVNAGTLLDADESLNITNAVLAKVNELYKAEKAAGKK